MKLQPWHIYASVYIELDLFRNWNSIAELHNTLLAEELFHAMSVDALRRKNASRAAELKENVWTLWAGVLL